MGRDKDNSFKTSHASPGYDGNNDNGTNGHSNGEHHKNVGNDEGWLSDFLGRSGGGVI